MTALPIGLCVACGPVAAVTAGKPVIVGGTIVPAAVFRHAFISISMATDLIRERLGTCGARRVVATAFAANLLLVGYVRSSGV